MRSLAGEKRAEILLKRLECISNVADGVARLSVCLWQMLGGERWYSIWFVEDVIRDWD